MPTAKSYSNLPILEDVFIKNGKTYVTVSTKTGPKDVRWYSDAEYRRMYGTFPEAEPASHKKQSTQKQALGFENGFITIFKGDTYSALEWFQASSARFTRLWGWYFISTDEVPTDLPHGIKPVRLPWELVGNEDGTLKPEDVIVEIVESFRYDTTPSEYQGTIGQRLTLELVVSRIIDLENAFGSSTMFIMYDENSNCYIWTTSTSKNWEEGEIVHIKGTVKEHRVYRGEKQTILTRCSLVK